MFGVREDSRSTDSERRFQEHTGPAKNGLDVLAQSLRWGEREESLRLHRHFLSRSLGWLIAGIWFLCRVVLVAWATLAIYYSNLPWAGLRLGVGGGLCGVRDLGALALASTAYVRGLHRAVSRRGRVVDIHSSLARSRVATGSRGDAAGDHRRRPRAHHRCPQLRLPQPERFHGAL